MIAWPGSEQNLPLWRSKSYLQIPSNENPKPRIGTLSASLQATHSEPHTHPIHAPVSLINSSHPTSCWVWGVALQYCTNLPHNLVLGNQTWWSLVSATVSVNRLHQHWDAHHVQGQRRKEWPAASKRARKRQGWWLWRRREGCGQPLVAVMRELWAVVPPRFWLLPGIRSISSFHSSIIIFYISHDSSCHDGCITIYGTWVVYEFGMELKSWRNHPCGLGVPTPH